VFFLLPSLHDLLKPLIVARWQCLHYSIPDAQLWEHLLLEVILEHLQKFFNQCQLENFLVDNSKYDFDIGHHFPSKHAVVVSVAILSDVLVVKQDILDQVVDQV
jgi:hypothetical protein